MLRFLKVSLALVVAISTLLVAQAAARGQTGAGTQTPQNTEGKLTTGPEDKTEKVAPGKIDADATSAYQTTASGLKYRVLRKSDQAKPSADDTVTVHYKGWLSSNQMIFDSSYRRGETISFPLNRVIKGWTEGMQLVGEGGMIELVIPSELAYGERGVPQAKIPPNAELTFLVELVDIK